MTNTIYLCIVSFCIAGIFISAVMAAWHLLKAEQYRKARIAREQNWRNFTCKHTNINRDELKGKMKAALKKHKFKPPIKREFDD